MIIVLSFKKEKVNEAKHAPEKRISQQKQWLATLIPQFPLTLHDIVIICLWCVHI